MPRPKRRKIPAPARRDPKDLNTKPSPSHSRSSSVEEAEELASENSDRNTASESPSRTTSSALVSRHSKTQRSRSSEAEQGQASLHAESSKVMENLRTSKRRSGIGSDAEDNDFNPQAESTPSRPQRGATRSLQNNRSRRSTRASIRQTAPDDVDSGIEDCEAEERTSPPTSPASSVMAPPQSLSSDEEGTTALPRSHTTAGQAASHREPRQGARTTSREMTTANLQRLLPKRRKRLHDEDASEDEDSAEGSDDDELARRRVAPVRKERQAMSKVKSSRTNVRRSSPIKNRLLETPQRKQNLDVESEESEGEGQVGDMSHAEIEAHQSAQKVAIDKFKDVDAWELDFEDAPSSGLWEGR